MSSSNGHGPSRALNASSGIASSTERERRVAARLSSIASKAKVVSPNSSTTTPASNTKPASAPTGTATSKPKAVPSAKSKSKAKPSKTSARASAALHPVDTNLAAHDRADPQGALAALRRLLTALPSRPGAAHLKLSADEHRLALHLLGLVEPFVHAPSSASASAATCVCACRAAPALARLPTEILDAVAFWVDGVRDLRALAGTCRRLQDVVVPRHTEYRVVRARASAVGVWRHLVVHRALARNVRRLEVLDERAPAGAERLPLGVGDGKGETEWEETENERGMLVHRRQERWLVRALERMTALRSVKWECGHSLVAFESVWPALVKCGSIEEVEVNDNHIFHAAAEDSSSGEDAAPKPRPLVLRDLKKAGFHGTKGTFGAAKEPDLTHISAMLNGCPNLETLAVSYVPRRAPGFFNPVADDFLLCGRWTNLRSLTLTNLWCTPDAGLDAAATFLLAHVNLEVLHLDVAFGGTGQAGGGGAALATFKFPPGCLPRLKELRANRDLTSALLACPVEGAGIRPLETLKGVRLTGSPRDRVFLENLRAYGAQTVRRLELGGWNEMEDVKRLAECVPRLTWLDLGKKEGSVGAGAGSTSKANQSANISSNFTEWANVLGQFSELTTFHGVRLFYEVATSDGAVLTLSDRSRVRKNDEVAAVLAWKCPKLRRVDHWEDGSGKVIVLVRDPEKVRYEVRRIKT
ncbi:hypothetical protein C8Q77DRAFT_1103526 [Trametes polyzona]|nr:hypothetical protein C8Q77DRAFT_1103526 [Trametes polyzona]